MLRFQNLLIGYKLFFGLFGFSAIVTEIATIVERGKFNPINFFSYFTVESNIMACVVLLLSAVAVAKGKSNKLSDFRGAAVAYILIVGLGFSFLLSGMENVVLTAVPWDNIVLHYIMPAAVFVDFLIDPLKTKVAFRRALYWLLFPLVYLTYTLTRGALTGWYPYPFLNPDTSGYEGIVLTTICLFVVGVGLVWIICKLSGRQKPRRRGVDT